nr:phosphatidylglycerophosphatase A [Neobacillus endophyticus]
MKKDMKKKRLYTVEEMKEYVIKKFLERGVTLESIAEIVLYLQKKYVPGLTLEESLFNVERVLSKREVLHAILTGLALDELAEKNLLPEPLQYLVETDEGLYGIDEVLVYSIVNVYGSIGYTNFGYVDKEKIGIIKVLDSCHEDGRVNTFLDDIVGAVAASAASRISHGKRDAEERQLEQRGQ